MTQDSGEKETSKSAVDGSPGYSQSHRRVARTLLDVNSPELKKIRKLLNIESPKTKEVRKVAKTLLEVPLPRIEKAQPTSTVAKTLLEANFPVMEQLEPDPVKPHSEPDALHAKPHRVERSKQFVAKTLLDHSVLADTLNKIAERKNERAAEEARERAKKPAAVFHPVDSEKLVQACAWRWDDESTDRFRYCPNCQTQAYNFDGLELAEAEALVFTRENKRNPILYKRADGKFMTQNCPAQVKRKMRRLVLFSIVAASVFLALLAMAILAPTLLTKHVVATDVTEQPPATAIGATGEVNDATIKAEDFSVQKNSDGTRKRPTFGPDDVQSYWE